MEPMHDDPDDGAGIPLGSTAITIRGLKIAGILLALLAAIQIARVWTGHVAWLGYMEFSVQRAPDWQHTPASTNNLRSVGGINLPMPAGQGQEIVIHYDLSSSYQDGSTPRARILVSCACPATNWEHLRIDAPGSGELTMTVKERGLYSLTFYQSAGPQGANSAGTYWWGLRQAQTQ